MEVKCYECKGRGYCDRKECALKTKAQAHMKHKDIVDSTDFSGTTPSVFVGHHGYPTLNVGLLTTPEQGDDVWKRDAPRHWAARNLEIPSIVDYRSSLLNSRFKANVKSVRKMLSLSQEAGMASKPVDVEIELDHKPSFRLDIDPYTAPTGPRAGMKRAILTSNPKVHRKVDKAVSDTDLKSTDALSSLYTEGFDENFLTRLLSIGNLGIGKNRKLVPTRWSITAVDDTVGKEIWKSVRDYQETDLLAYFGGYLGNYYLILMFPGAWSYELFEVYLPKTDWNPGEDFGYATDYEPYCGRKTYAQSTAGGYYAARLPILEKLNSRKRKGSVLAIRMITGDYSVPLGVWVCREATRKALAGEPISFGSSDLMLNYAQALVKKKFGHDLSRIIRESKLLKDRREQRRLSSY